LQERKEVKFSLTWDGLLMRNVVPDSHTDTLKISVTDVAGSETDFFSIKRKIGTEEETLLAITNDGLKVSGEIEAKSGAIGSWEINADSLTNEARTIKFSAEPF
jgi:hypothetical protein